jgi:hypothetical protein
LFASTENSQKVSSPSNTKGLAERASIQIKTEANGWTWKEDLRNQTRRRYGYSRLFFFPSFFISLRSVFYNKNFLFRAKRKEGPRAFAAIKHSQKRESAKKEGEDEGEDRPKGQGKAEGRATAAQTRAEAEVGPLPTRGLLSSEKENENLMRSRMIFLFSWLSFGSWKEFESRFGNEKESPPLNVLQIENKLQATHPTVILFLLFSFFLLLS